MKKEKERERQRDKKEDEEATRVYTEDAEGVVLFFLLSLCLALCG